MIMPDYYSVYICKAVFCNSIHILQHIAMSY